MTLYNFPTSQHLVILIQDITAKGFKNPHTKFGVLLYMHLGVLFCLVILMLVYVSSKKMCLSRHSAYHLKAHRISNIMAPNLAAQR